MHRIHAFVCILCIEYTKRLTFLKDFSIYLHGLRKLWELLSAFNDKYKICNTIYMIFSTMNAIIETFFYPSIIFLFSDRL